MRIFNIRHQFVVDHYLTNDHYLMKLMKFAQPKIHASSCMMRNYESIKWGPYCCSIYQHEDQYFSLRLATHCLLFSMLHKFGGIY